ncbi:MAG: S8 family serine peptidase [Rhodobacteraceae bacterium]|nr:S8 family serine peptidase [Paracoccaceae bacterium]
MIMGRRHRLAAAVAAALAAGLPAGAKSAPSIAIADGRGGTAAAAPEALLARAAARGRLPVIVGLAAGFVPEGALDADAVAAQRAGIAAAQAALLARLAAPHGVKRFATVPALALQASEADLRTILAAPEAAQVTEEVPAPPALAESAGIIDAPKLWKKGWRGAGQAVAVLDTGVRRNHRAFARRILSEACYSANVDGDSSSLCPDGADAATGPGTAQDCPTSLAGCGHGTHVAGIAMGNHPDARGIAHQAQLIAIKVFSRFETEEFCGAGSAPCALSWPSDQMLGLERVLELADEQTIAAVNISIGGGEYAGHCDGNTMKAVIDSLLSRGIPTVIAAGNNYLNGKVGAPGCISSAVTVGSTTKDDDVSDFSNHARMVDLMAPGSDITAPVADGDRGATGVKSGTSMAAPHVAGAWALIRQAHPEAAPDEVARALVCTGELVTRNYLPRSRIDLDAAERFLGSAPAERRWSFTTDRQAAQWVPNLGDWARVGNTLQATGRVSPRASLASSPFCVGDMEVTAQVRRVDPDGVWYSGLLLFSRIDAQARLSGLWFSFQRDSSEEPGSARIWALDGVDGISGRGGPARLLCRNDRTRAIRAGEFNTLKVISEDGRHRFFINNREVCGADEASYTTGNVAVMMGADGPEHIYQVNRVHARTLDDGASAAAAAGAEAHERAAPGAALTVVTGEGALAAALGGDGAAAD